MCDRDSEETHSLRGCRDSGRMTVVCAELWRGSLLRYLVPKHKHTDVSNVLAKI